MNTFLIVAGVCIVVSLISIRVFSHIGVPALLAFILLGMFCGEDGPVGIAFSNYELCKNVCMIGLVFIMFYGGFSAKWSAARPHAVESLALASLGTVITAGVVGVGAHLLLDMSIAESFLLGAVISSTDAASVFSVLRAQRLNLKGGLASVLEVESGSNDPFAYLLTFVALLLVQGDVGAGTVISTLVIQLVVGAACGVLLALGTCFVMGKTGSSDNDAMAPVLLIAVAMLAFALPESVGGNGFLSVYLAGLITGNSTRIHGKTAIVHFFDGTTQVAQIMIFFLFGLLAFPSNMLAVLPQGVAVFLVLTFLARPIATTAIGKPARRTWREIAFVSASGLRGASSLTFALVALESLSGAGLMHGFGLYHTVMWVVILSILLQGPLLPLCARKLGLVDDNESVMRTFTDYEELSSYTLLEIEVRPGGPWDGRTLGEAGLPSGFLVLLVHRGDQEIVPHGATVLHAGDQLVISAPSYTPREGDGAKLSGAGGTGTQREDARGGRGDGGTPLRELTLGPEHPWVGRRLSEVPLAPNGLAVLVKRGNETLLPQGTTKLLAGDVVVYSGQLPEEARG